MNRWVNIWKVIVIRLLLRMMLWFRSYEMRIKDLLNMTSGLLYPQEGVAGMAVAEVFNEIHEKSCTEMH